MSQKEIAASPAEIAFDASKFFILLAQSLEESPSLRLEVVGVFGIDSLFLEITDLGGIDSLRNFLSLVTGVISGVLKPLADNLRFFEDVSEETSGLEGVDWRGDEIFISVHNYFQ